MSRIHRPRLYLVLAGFALLIADLVVELVSDATLVGENAGSILFGLLVLVWVVPDARTATGTDRLLHRIMAVAGLLLIVGGVGDLLS